MSSASADASADSDSRPIKLLTLPLEVYFASSVGDGKTSYALWNHRVLTTILFGANQVMRRLFGIRVDTKLLKDVGLKKDTELNVVPEIPEEVFKKLLNRSELNPNQTYLLCVLNVEGAMGFNLVGSEEWTNMCVIAYLPPLDSSEKSLREYGIDLGARVVAHELGHSLSLKHTIEINNLMYKGSLMSAEVQNAKVTALNVAITQEQRQRARMFGQCKRRILGGTPSKKECNDFYRAEGLSPESKVPPISQ
jgi:hypothetical protein